MQLRVLGLGLLQDGDIGIGVLPECKECLIIDESLAANRICIGGMYRLRLNRVSACHTQMSQRSNGFVDHNSPMINDLLKLRSSCTGLTSS